MSPLERNIQRLESLEQEWSELGPLRQICFQGRFVDYSDQEENAVPPREAAERFAALAREEGCECYVSYGESEKTCYVAATKKMEPVAENITLLQERLASFANYYPGGYLDGWNYPAKKQVEFWPNCSLSNKEAAKARAAVLFGAELATDPLQHRAGISFSSIMSGKPNRTPATLFTFVPSEFLRRAQDRPPKDAQPTASAFSQWVYSIYGNMEGGDEDRERGLEAEKEIFKLRGAAFGSNGNEVLKRMGSPWYLIHNGLHLDEKNIEYFEVPNLRVAREPLRASPDLIYVNRKTSEVIIVEIKYSQLQITKNLWPNVWAQLWCYSHIAVAANAPKVTVVGEVWGQRWSRGHGRGRNWTPGERLICLRASVRRNPRASAYDQFFRALFQIYCGTYT